MSDEDASRPEAVIEGLVRQSLAARAGSLHAEPDPLGLASRIARQAERSARRARLAVAASVIVLSGALGGVLAGTLTPANGRSSYSLSASEGDQAGGLPTGPSLHGRSSRHRLVAASSKSNRGKLRSTQQGASGLSVFRSGTNGALLQATAAWLPPVLVSSGSAVPTCYGYELVSTSARAGGVTARSVGVVGIDPVGATGLEVLDSGSASLGARGDLWWATVAVGPAVARLAAAQPAGGTDATRPQGGIGLLGGIVPARDIESYFSVVAETFSGEALGSIGFQLGWGPEASSFGHYEPGGQGSAHCVISAALMSQTGAETTSRPGAPLLAASSVIAAFQQLYGTSSSQQAVQIAGVRFLSAVRAEAIYRVGTRPWDIGVAALGRAGMWQVESGG